MILNTNTVLLALALAVALKTQTYDHSTAVSEAQSHGIDYKLVTLLLKRQPYFPPESSDGKVHNATTELTDPVVVQFS